MNPKYKKCDCCGTFNDIPGCLACDPDAVTEEVEIEVFEDLDVEP